MTVLYGHYFFSSMILLSLSIGIVFLSKYLPVARNERLIFVSAKKTDVSDLIDILKINRAKYT